MSVAAAAHTMALTCRQRVPAPFKGTHLRFNTLPVRPRSTGHANKSPLSPRHIEHGLQRTALRAVSDQTAGELDTGALGKYFGAVGTQVTVMTGALWVLQQVSSTLATMDLPGGIDSSEASKALVTLYFLVVSIKSRIFSPLDASRPKISSEKQAIRELRRPSWMPPPLTFPIVWTTIGVLRAVSSVMVWEASGRELVTLPLIVMALHLSIGDCWNHINNQEKKLGVAVPGVLCCLASAIAVVAAYYQADTIAGYVLAPSAMWISIASVLVYSIWDLNGKQPLYPIKGAASQ